MILSQQRAAAGTHTPTGYAGLAVIRDAIELDRELTWVFTGTRLDGRPDVATVAERVGRQLRSKHERAGDTIVDTTKPGDTVSMLAGGYESRVQKFDPSVVVITVGEGADAIEQRLNDCQALGRLLESVRRDDAVAVVVPPPAYLGDRDDAKLCRWRDDVVELATALDAILVPTASCRGVDAVVERLLHTLGLDQFVAKQTPFVTPKPVPAAPSPSVSSR